MAQAGLTGEGPDVMFSRPETTICLCSTVMNGVMVEGKVVSSETV